MIADDLVVSNTPRRIRRTSNSSADRYGFLVDSRRGLRHEGDTGWKKRRCREEGGRERECVSEQRGEREREGVFGGAGVAVAHGDASGVFPWRRELPAGVAWRAQGGAPSPRPPLSFSEALLSSFFPRRTSDFATMLTPSSERVPSFRSGQGGRRRVISVHQAGETEGSLPVEDSRTLEESDRESGTGDVG